MKPTTFARKAFKRIKAELGWQRRLDVWDGRRFDRMLWRRYGRPA